MAKALKQRIRILVENNEANLAIAKVGAGRVAIVGVDGKTSDNAERDPSLFARRTRASSRWEQRTAIEPRSDRIIGLKSTFFTN